MRTLYSILIILSLALFFTSCKPDEKLKDQLTLVYVDLSCSQDTQSIAGMLKKIEMIFMGQSKEVNNRFIVRAIDKDNSAPPLFEHTIEQLCSKRSIKEQQYNEEKQTQADRLRDTILNRFKNMKKTRCQESCICNSLENAHLTLNSIDTAKWEVKVIVLSDMFEECSQKNSYLKVDFYMCKKGGSLSDPKDLKATIETNYAPEHLLSRYVKPENLYFILTESEQHNDSGKKCLNANDKEKLWKDILKKMGYRDQENIDNPGGITYTHEIPEKLLNK